MNDRFFSFNNSNNNNDINNSNITPQITPNYTVVPYSTNNRKMPFNPNSTNISSNINTIDSQLTILKPQHQQFVVQLTKLIAEETNCNKFFRTIDGNKQLTIRITITEECSLTTLLLKINQLERNHNINFSVSLSYLPNSNMANITINPHHEIKYDFSAIENYSNNNYKPINPQFIENDNNNSNSNNNNNNNKNNNKNNRKIIKKK